MLIPLGVLSLGAVLAGFIFTHDFISEGAGHFWQGSIAFGEELIHHMHAVPGWVKWAPFMVMVTGFAIAFYGYVANTAFPARVTAALGPVYRFVYNKWYFDELYDRLFVKPAFWIGEKFWKLGDIGIIDRFGPNGAAWAVARGSSFAQKVQTGYLYSYALVMLLGLTAAITWVMVH
jgi:NADH-quinone oxidoreductase subunit L